MKAYINRIETAVPEHEVHGAFIDYVRHRLSGRREATLFARLASRSAIETRYSFVQPHHELSATKMPDSLDADGFYQNGSFPTTARRMAWYEERAIGLAVRAATPIVERIGAESITHLIVTSCTGFYAPGLDLDLLAHLGLRRTVQRSVIGFMGCYAGLTALRQADAIVRSDASARVLVVAVELCTLHLQDKTELQDLLGFLQFSDGSAAALVSADQHGLEITGFASAVSPEASPHITWRIGDFGFDMNLSLEVPATLAEVVPQSWSALWPSTAFGERPRFWAVHPGGRAILDSVESCLGLGASDLDFSRDVLKRFGNMSSATIFFVLRQFVTQSRLEGPGLALAFGPGLTIESMRWQSRMS